MDFTKPPVDQYYRNAKILRLVDGDTIRLDIDDGRDNHGKETVRLARVDTPESNRHPEMPAGRWVTDRVRLWIGDATDVAIHSLKFKQDSFARIIAEVWVDGRNLSQFLLDHKYAWPTDSNGKIFSADGQITNERDIDRLTGIPEDIRQMVRMGS